MIEKIELKQVATYDKNGTSLQNLQKINFIYGANGSGKTTVSNFILNPLDSKYQNCNMHWRSEQALETVVYNKEFKNRNFNSTNTIKGVFTLGQATDEEIKTIDSKKEQLATIQEHGKGFKTKLDELKGNDEIAGKIQTLDEESKELFWKKIYKVYEPYFKEAFKGSMNKQSFKNKLLQEYHATYEEVLSLDTLQEKAKTIFGETPLALEKISRLEFLELNQIEYDSIWTQRIIGKADVDIAKLIQRLNINDWVNQGQNFILEDNTCPFCQQETITDDFRKQLEEYFDRTFIEDINKVKNSHTRYETLMANLINQLNHIETEQKNIKNTKLDTEKFSIYLKTFISQVNVNKEIISQKVKEPSRALKLTTTEEQLLHIQTLINTANEQIKVHNQIVQNYKDEKARLIDSIWEYIIDTHRDMIQDYIKKKMGLEKGVESLREQYRKKRQEWTDLNQEIKQLGKNVTSVQPTIDEINRLLKYYGFLNFEIVPSQENQNQYQIKREDGSLAQETLSEGEITFITFLYYYHLAKGSTNHEEISNDRILVIDDPISSLDSNVLFVVSTLLKGIIEDIRGDKGNIKQLIILTHNVYFHKEVAFTNGRDNGRNDTYFWILRKNNKVSTFNSYEKQNPIQTSYQLLWRELKDKEKSSMITIQNTMRRIIENYFKILGNYSDDNLIEKFDTYEEQTICRSLISWINDGSHSVADDLYIENQDDSIEKYLNVFQK
ncbi:MAG: AAA family ATPase, partial [Campylobacterota bacterium]|nr:AAA family ATPase [Campylobacterota bacterium]